MTEYDERSGDELWRDINAKFNDETEKMRFQPVDKAECAARFLWYASVLYSLGMDDEGMASFLGVAKRTMVEFGDSSEIGN